MSESVNAVTDDDFESAVLEADLPVLVDFWAEWCTPCHIVSPIVEEIARDHAGKMKVVNVLESLPGLGKVKARRLME